MSNHEDGSLRSSWDPSFIWPKSGPVEAPEWFPGSSCGRGLHGWQHGKGKPVWSSNLSNDVMMVVEVLRSDIVDLGGKVKFPKGNVIFTGTRAEVTTFMASKGHTGLVYGDLTVGDGETALVGDRGRAVAGNKGTAIAGNNGTAIVGAGGRAEVGFYGKASAGIGGTLVFHFPTRLLVGTATYSFTVSGKSFLPDVFYVCTEEGFIEECSDV